MHFQVHEDLSNGGDDDIDSSGSGYGDDEDDIPTSNKDKSHIKTDQTTNTLHHSGDGSDHHDDTENTDYPEIHEDHTPLHPHKSDSDDDHELYFDNSTDTDKPFNPTTTDDEDSQLIFYLFIIFSFSLF